jgi:hypothetical protein
MNALNSKVIWFSRHAPTAEQLADLASERREIVALEKGMALGACAINSEGDLQAVIGDLRDLAKDQGAVAIYGVFATPVQSIIADRTVREAPHSGSDDCIPCWASWNVARSVEGGKPTFSHRRFMWVGFL